MEKQKPLWIDVEHLSYKVISDMNEYFPLPAEICKDIEELHVVGRLISTRGGGASWEVGKKWREHSSNSPYRPTINATVENATIRTWIGRVDSSEPAEDELIVSRLAGYWGRDFVLTIHGKPESNRPKRKELFEEIDKEKYLGEEIVQGHLVCRRLTAAGGEMVDNKIIELGIELNKDPVWLKRDSIRIFNHEVYSSYHNLLFVGYDNKRLIKIRYEEGRGEILRIVSPDHLNKPLRLQYEGWWLLEHPLPEDNID